MDKLIDNNIHRISCEVNGCEDMGLSFNFLYYDKNDDFSFSEIYQEDDVLNVQKTIGNINLRLIQKQVVLILPFTTNRKKHEKNTTLYYRIYIYSIDLCIFNNVRTSSSCSWEYINDCKKTYK